MDTTNTTIDPKAAANAKAATEAAYNTGLAEAKATRAIADSAHGASGFEAARTAARAADARLGPLHAARYAARGIAFSAGSATLGDDNDDK